MNKFSQFFSRPKSVSPASTGPVEYIVAGLGNPGREYELTRHNAGFLAVDRMAEKWNIPIKRLKFKALCGDGTVAGHRVLLLKPSTYMNNSGEAVREAMQFYKVPMEKVIVLCDDITLEPGKMRIRRKGSDGGQKGLRSIITLTGRDDFPRVRIGVGAKPHPRMDLADWVLSKLSKQEMEAMAPIWDSVSEAVELILSGDMDQAMSRFN